jgi:FlaA1/EpsC-like NDP-sugar epimerase
MVMRWMSELVRRLQTRPAASPPAIDFARLLGREPVNLDTPELQRFIAGKRVLVTGAGGSIGSEICRQAARFCPSRLVLVERSEGALFEIDHDLRQRWIGLDPVPLLLDVTDARRVRQAFTVHRPEVVFHAAAHKHVPLMEHNAAEAIRNNVFGTRGVAEATAESGADAFVLISTDKAVNPSSVMGATKRVAELIVQSLAESAQRRGGSAATRFLAVRFGNVLASSGSVVPIFQRQIAAGGPVTVTHPEMRRYFMSIPEAAQLVMQAGAIGHGGELFVLDMGEPVRILDLARRLVEAHGLRPDRDIELRVTGVRPGEKLFEQLCYDDEHTLASGHDRIRVWRCRPVDAPRLGEALSRLQDAAEADDPAVAAVLAEVVPEYRHTPCDPAARPPLRLVA